MTISTVADQSTRESSIHDAIAQRARELWELGGRREGHAEEDWKQAESEILTQLAARVPARRRRIVVKTAGVIYTGEYDPATANWYRPGDLRTGSEIQLQFQGDSMIIKFPGGKRLEAKITRREPTSEPAADPRTKRFVEYAKE